jgi:hypothetical protein
MITQPELKEKLHYNPDTGIFIWKVSIGKVKPDQVAGFIGKNGYRIIRVNSKNYISHRLAWLYVYGKFPSVIDHINCIRNDNRLCNLRECTNQQNQWNQKNYSTNTSKVKGVSWNTKLQKWKVGIRTEIGRIHLGYFKSLDDAKSVIIEARNKYHKEFANHGY